MVDGNEARGCCCSSSAVVPLSAAPREITGGCGSSSSSSPCDCLPSAATAAFHDGGSGGGRSAKPRVCVKACWAMTAVWVAASDNSTAGIHDGPSFFALTPNLEEKQQQQLLLLLSLWPELLTSQHEHEEFGERESAHGGPLPENRITFTPARATGCGDETEQPPLAVVEMSLVLSFLGRHRAGGE